MFERTPTDHSAAELLIATAIVEAIMLIGAAIMLMAFTLVVSAGGAALVWKGMQFVFGWGKKHCNWTGYPNLNGVLFLVLLLGAYLLLSLIVGNASSASQQDPWERLFMGMATTAGIIIDIVLVSIGGYWAIAIIIGGILSIKDWLKKK